MDTEYLDDFYFNSLKAEEIYKEYASIIFEAFKIEPK